MAHKRIVLLVLGMHRSGTSALTRVLGFLGASLPARPLPPDDDNPDGYWEPAALNAFDERLLAAVGSRWDDWRPLDLEDLGAPARQQLAAELTDAVQADFADAPLLALKDPRIARLVPFYAAALAATGLELRALIPVRSASAVAASLAARDGMTPTYAALLWLRHVLQAEADTRGWCRVFPSHEGLVGDWRQEIGTLSAHLRVPWPVPVAVATPEIDTFLRPGPARQTPPPLSPPGPVGVWLTEATFALQALHADPHDPAAMAGLDRIRAALDAAATGFAAELQDELAARQRWYQLRLAGARAEAEAARSSAAEEISGLAATVAAQAVSLQQAARGLAETVAGRDAEAASAAAWRRQAEETDAALREARATLSLRDAALAASAAGHAAALQTLEEAKRAAETERTRLTAEADAARAATDRATARRAAIEASACWRLSEPLRRLAALGRRWSWLLGREVALRPAHQVVSLGNGKWSLTGHDPNFLLDWAGPGLPPGHYELRLDFPGGGSGLPTPKLYVDSSHGFNEYEAQSLPAVGSGTRRLVAGFSLPQGARALRFDPADLPGVMSAGPGRLRRLTRAEYYARAVARALARARRDDGALLPAIGRGASLLLDQGPAAAAAALRQAARAGPASLPRRNGPRLVPDVPVYVPPGTEPPPAQTPVRLIAFYLPQFHPIPENDLWWGEGFTEWTKVGPARPLFAGHYQPHEPDLLGRYDLRDPQVQHAQMQLARRYGLGGFCFYFYWLGGTVLLETPTRNWLDDPSLDFPFCLCWANENWTRRWDGLESEVLIGQRHSPADDLAFIAHIAPYLRDPRYIRIDGKPLLLVYRPGLLPAARDTAVRWRAWCRDNGVGEIHLAYTQAFDRADPADYGFDAAVEFPPNNSDPPDITADILPPASGFAGKIYDWRVFPERSATYAQPGYTLYRGVATGWDNTARRGERASIFVNATPALFGRWLRHAITDTARRFPEPERRLVFVNAWNEWAEGAHLEPDRRYGFAWLQAARDALAVAGRLLAPSPEQRLAVVIHAFYADVLGEILAYVSRLPPGSKLFVSVPAQGAASARALLEATGLPFELDIVDNRGRDVLPFLRLLRRARGEGFMVVLKVHTKKSPHRVDGARWRAELYAELLDAEVVALSLAALAESPGLGMIGPARHFVAMTTYFGANEQRILALGAAMGLEPPQIMGQGFFAGTMFIARIDALAPLLALSLSDADFEVEDGQIDGTLAHALERAMTLSVLAAGLTCAATDLTPLTGGQAVTTYGFV